VLSVQGGDIGPGRPHAEGEGLPPIVERGIRQRPAGPRRRMGRRAHRHAEPGRLAQGHADHRPQGTPAPRAQLRLTDIDGHRLTCFATSTTGGQLADLQLRHRRRARCDDRIRCAKDTGLRNFPLHGCAQNQVWTEIVALACELLAWTAMHALDGTTRRLGIEAPAAPALLCRRADSPRRPPHPAEDFQPMALDCPDHRCHHQARRPRARLPGLAVPTTMKGRPTRARGTRPTGQAAGPPG